MPSISKSFISLTPLIIRLLTRPLLDGVEANLKSWEKKPVQRYQLLKLQVSLSRLMQKPRRILLHNTVDVRLSQSVVKHHRIYVCEDVV